MIIGRKVGSASEVRDHIIDSLRRELVGPSPGHPAMQLTGEEILRPQDPPRYRYSCGILFPKGVTYSGSLNATEEVSGIEAAAEVTVENAPTAELPEEDAEEVDDQGAGADSTPEIDTEVDTASMFLPSTMGLSFLAKVSGGLIVNVSWGTYRKVDVPGYDNAAGQSNNQRETKLWFRNEGQGTVKLDPASFDRRHHREALHSSDLGAVLLLDIVSRPRGTLRLITVTLMNASPDVHPVNENCFFQCGFSVEPSGTSIIEPYPGRPELMQDPEERSLSLLYRHRPTYAVGCGCSADWTAEHRKIL